MPGIGFLLQSRNIISFNTTPIELKQGASRALNDFSLTSMAGRVGQGLAILYGHSIGLEFTAHLRSYVEALPSGSPGANHKTQAMADFIFADNQNTVLVESKGSFRLEANNPSDIKTTLKKALEKQIDPWMTRLKPAPSNGYVVYSCLREGAWDPSAIFVVDPEGDENDDLGLPFSAAQVRAENYGAWLRAMGLDEAARRLTQPFAEVGEPMREDFLIYEFDGRKYAFREDCYHDYYLWGWPAPALGIDLVALYAISSAIQSRDRGIEGFVIDLPKQQEWRYDDASVFPDGSIFVDLWRQPIARETFLL